MQQKHRLRRESQFNYVYRRGKKASCRDLSLLYVKNPHKRVGFSVSKKVGVAVVRNRTKRRLRECVRPLLPLMRNGLYVLVARPTAALCPYDKLDQSVRALMRKLDLLGPGEGQGPRP